MPVVDAVEKSHQSYDDACYLLANALIRPSLESSARLVEESGFSTVTYAIHAGYDLLLLLLLQSLLKDHSIVPKHNLTW